TPDVSTNVRPEALDPSKLTLPLTLSGVVSCIVCPASLGENLMVSPFFARETSWGSDPAPLPCAFMTVRVLRSVRPSNSEATGRMLVRARRANCPLRVGRFRQCLTSKSFIGTVLAPGSQSSRLLPVEIARKSDAGRRPLRFGRIDNAARSSQLNPVQSADGC